MPVELSEAARELVIAEAQRVAERVDDERAKALYGRVAREAEAGALDDELLTALGNLLELGFAGGRIRARHGAHAEMAATSLYRLTPQGQALHAQFAEATKALAALSGQTLERITLAARGPGMVSLSIETTEANLSIAFDAKGVQVRSVEVGA